MNDKVQEILNEVGKVIRGKDEAIELVMTAMLAKGHILVEDVPGVGKTTLAVAFSRAMELTELVLPVLRCYRNPSLTVL